MARKRLTAVLAVAGSLVLAVPVAQAALAVFDGTAVGKAIEQINELKQQLATQLEQLKELKDSVSFLNDISKFSKEVSDAIGSVTHITLPIANIQKLATQARSDMVCLMPDGANWGLALKDIDLGSICETSSKYKDALFLSSKKLKDMSAPEQDAARIEVAQRRAALLADTVVRSLAQADVQMKQADTLTSAADQLQDDLNSAETVQDRLHVSAEAQIAQLRATAAQTQLLAQMLRLQTAVATKVGLRRDELVTDKDEDNGESGK